jgi:hypothetical protein
MPLNSQQPKTSARPIFKKKRPALHIKKVKYSDFVLFF